MENLSLLDRFLADTPPFFKKTHLLGIGMIAAAFTLDLTSNLVPVKWLMVIGFVGLAIALLSVFAVKLENTIQAGEPVTLETFTGAIAQVTDDVKLIKSLIQNPPTSLAQIEAIVNDPKNSMPADGVQSTVVTAKPAPEIPPVVQ